MTLIGGYISDSLSSFLQQALYCRTKDPRPPKHRSFFWRSPAPCRPPPLIPPAAGGLFSHRCSGQPSLLLQGPIAFNFFRRHTITITDDQARHESADSDLAVGGFDIVACFTRQRPIEGTRDFTVNQQGLVDRFSGIANRKLFVSEPNRYLTQYGGPCAFAMSENVRLEIDPTAFSVVDNKLYLCKSSLVLWVWLHDADLRITWADQHWSTLSPLSLSSN